jgi:hypothetical protein
MSQKVELFLLVVNSLFYKLDNILRLEKEIIDLSITESKDFRRRNTEKDYICHVTRTFGAVAPYRISPKRLKLLRKCECTDRQTCRPVIVLSLYA